MSVARTWAVALSGIDGAIVEVEASVVDGKDREGIELIGLPDKALGEAVRRVQSASANLGLRLPHRRLMVNLSPATLPKRGSAFDLAIAVAAQAISVLLDPAVLTRTVLIGELGLDGRVRPVAGVLPAVIAAQRGGFSRVVVPHANADEAGLVAGVEVVAAVSLVDALIACGATLAPVDREPVAGRTSPSAELPVGDLADVVGQADAVEAMTIAAAGRHHIAMSGPPGAGKTMLASRLPSILPPLETDAARTVASVMSLSGTVLTQLPSLPPFVAPHHTATVASLVGGGTGVIGPGAISRASEGVLYLDEALEFSSVALDALRQPLESGRITIHRAGATATFPARFLLAISTNPCPCGRHGVRGEICTCPPATVLRYAKRMSGPLRDRIDVDFSVRRVSALGATAAPSSAATLQRVLAARERALARLRSTPWRCNGDVPGPALRADDLRLPTAATAPLETALARNMLTMRGADRVLRLAWTIADLDGHDRPGLDEVARALFLRRGVAA